MKILMLHDCAYVGYELAKELRERGIIVHHLNYFDKSGFNIKKVFRLVKITFKSLLGDYDFIHVHYLGTASYIPYFLKKSYVVHIHGSDVRNPLTNESTLTDFKRMVIEKAKLILYSTHDLKKYLPERAKRLPTPIGKQFFKVTKRQNKCIGKRRLWYTKNNKLVTDELKGYSYKDMPNLLKKYSVFVDQNKIKALSKTAWEALASGSNVINWKGQLVCGKFPESHKVENVVDKLLSYYKLVGLC